MPDYFYRQVRLDHAELENYEHHIMCVRLTKPLDIEFKNGKLISRPNKTRKMGLSLFDTFDTDKWLRRTSSDKQEIDLYAQKLLSPLEPDVEPATFKIKDEVGVKHSYVPAIVFCVEQDELRRRVAAVTDSQGMPLWAIQKDDNHHHTLYPLVDIVLPTSQVFNQETFAHLDDFALPHVPWERVCFAFVKVQANDNPDTDQDFDDLTERLIAALNDDDNLTARSILDSILDRDSFHEENLAELGAAQLEYIAQLLRTSEEASARNDLHVIEQYLKGTDDPSIRQ